jgi:carboxyl-terminal processing protease
VQTLADLDQVTNGKIVLGSLKITIQQFFRVDGPSTQREGVTPDIMLPDPAGHIESGERELEHAIAASKINAVKHDIWPAKWNPSALAQKSAARVAKQPMLTKIAAATALLKARMKDTRVPLAEKTWLTRRKDQKTALEAASPDLKKQPAAFGVAVVEDPNATVTPPPGGGKKDDRLAKWSDNLAHDPWVDECLSILGDMK